MEKVDYFEVNIVMKKYEKPFVATSMHVQGIIPLAAVGAAATAAGAAATAAAGAAYSAAAGIVASKAFAAGTTMGMGYAMAQGQRDIYSRKRPALVCK